MLKCFHFVLSIFLLFELSYVHADIGTISGYPQVDIRDLNALTLSWNQVSIIIYTMIKPISVYFDFIRLRLH